MAKEICKLLEVQSHQGTAYMYKAEEILAKIEKAGMLPPERVVYTDVDSNVLCSTDCSWEPENE